MGENLTYDKNEEELNDSLETDKMTGREGERKVVNVLKGEKRAKF